MCIIGLLSSQCPWPKALLKVWIWSPGAPLWLPATPQRKMDEWREQISLCISVYMWQMKYLIIWTFGSTWHLDVSRYFCHMQCIRGWLQSDHRGGIFSSPQFHQLRKESLELIGVYKHRAGHIRPEFLCWEETLKKNSLANTQRWEQK